MINDDDPEGEVKRDASFRPNQLFAIGLLFPLITGAKANSILKIATEKLYTPFGLRSLSPDDANYKGTYRGNQQERDAAYHQGTVWSWLLGIYVDSLMMTGEKSSRQEAELVIQRFIPHLNDACIGSVSEIFSGDTPFTPAGCVAQAWGVAEVLRVVKRYSLYSEK